jgi:hypothetical protein
VPVPKPQLDERHWIEELQGLPSSSLGAHAPLDESQYASVLQVRDGDRQAWPIAAG